MWSRFLGSLPATSLHTCLCQHPKRHWELVPGTEIFSLLCEYNFSAQVRVPLRDLVGEHNVACLILILASRQSPSTDQLEMNQHPLLMKRRICRQRLCSHPHSEVSILENCSGPMGLAMVVQCQESYHSALGPLATFRRVCSPCSEVYMGSYQI